MPPGQSTVPRLQSVTDDAQPGVVLTNLATEESFQANKRELLADLPWLVTDNLEPATIDACELPPIEPDGLAYLQYHVGFDGCATRRDAHARQRRAEPPSSPPRLRL